MSLPKTSFDYDCQKAILKHMDPNQRTSLLSRCPSIKTADQWTTQKIDLIQLEPFSITINNTSYSLGIIQHHRPGAVVPEDIMERNEEGGATYDMDKWGFRIASAPEDVHIPADPRPNEYWYHRITGRNFDYRKRSPPEILTDEQIRKEIQRPSKIIPNTLVNEEFEILKCRLRLDQNERDIPFDLHLQLVITTTNPDGQKVRTVEWVEYNRSLGYTMKYIIGRLLKKEKNYANTLRITTVENLWLSCHFWLPPEMNLTAQHLRIDFRTFWVLNGFARILNRVNPRFKSVAVSPDDQLIFNHEVVSTAEMLIFHTHSFYVHPHMLRISRVHIDFALKPSDYRDLLNEWRENGASIGTYHSLGANIVEGYQWYNYMKENGQTEIRRDGLEPSIFPDCVTIPLAFNTQLFFYIEDLTHQFTEWRGNDRELMIHLIVEGRI